MRKPKLKVKCIFLDLDGTIVDSREAYLEAMRTAMTKTGQRTIDIEAVTEIPKRLEQSLPIDDLIEGVDTQEFLKAYLQAYYEATVTKAKPVPSIADTLRKLSEKAKLAVITMRHVPREKVTEELKRFGLAEYIQDVTTGLDTQKPKPSPEALIKCARKLDVKISECAVVGDSVSDVKAGKAAGAKTVAVLTGIFSREELEEECPDLILDNVKELPDFLE
jgi:HAD superfamily hydrolase (TIGR01509 family)